MTMRRWYEFPHLQDSPFIAYLVCDLTTELLAIADLHLINEGSLGYVKEDGQFYVFNGTIWSKAFKAK